MVDFGRETSGTRGGALPAVKYFGSCSDGLETSKFCIYVPRPRPRLELRETGVGAVFRGREYDFRNARHKISKIKKKKFFRFFENS